jgi:starch synthase
LFGILNGIDITTFDPQTDPALPANYDLDHLDGRRHCKTALQKEFGLEPAPDIPVLSLTSRLQDQKGYDILSAILAPLLEHVEAQWIIMGVGEQYYHDALRHLQARYPGRLGLELTYDESLRRRIFAGSDIFLMPSRHEPCGLDQLIAMRYGAVPLVHATGGLADTVRNHHLPTVGTGITFGAYDSMALFAAIVRGVELYNHPAIWTTIQHNAMRQDVSWTQPAHAYHDLYRRARSFKLTGAPA